MDKNKECAIFIFAKMKIKTFRIRRISRIHAAAEFHILGRKYSPYLGPMCNPAMTERAFNRLRPEELEHTQVNCGRCRRMPEFEDLIRSRAVRITLSSV
jgi:hypothetical protein